MNKAEIKKATLDWCNEMREERGVGPPLDELPKGTVRNPKSCPCGKATGLEVGVSVYGIHNHSAWWLPLPPAVQSFVALFDNGEYPELIEDGTNV
jgi:hypothetical protein